MQGKPFKIALVAMALTFLLSVTPVLAPWDSFFDSIFPNLNNIYYLGNSTYAWLSGRITNLFAINFTAVNITATNFYGLIPFSNVTEPNLDVDWSGQLNVTNITGCPSDEIWKANASGIMGCSPDLGAGVADTDTNATTGCGADQLLSGDEGCIGYIDGWNRTQGNTSAQIILAINTTGYYQIQVKNATQAVNTSYEYWTNETLMRRDNVSYEWFNNATIFQTYNHSYDSTLGSNTTAEILALIPADTNATSICTGFTALFGNGSCAVPFNNTINFTALTSSTLDWVWSGLLYWGNVTGYNLDSVWLGQLHWGNISHRTLDIAWEGEGLNVTNITGCDSGEIWKANASNIMGCAPDIDTDTANSSAEMTAVCVDRTDWTAIDDYPAGCTNQFITGLGDTMICASVNETMLAADISLGWANLTSYPGTCTASQYISAFGDTTSCAAIAITESQVTDLVHTTDTNASTECTVGDQILTSGKSCLTFVDGWNRTDQGNTSTQMITAINTTEYYQSTARNATDLICTNCIGGTEIAELADADISNTLTCSDLVAASEVVADTEVSNDITIVSTKWINTTKGINMSADSLIYATTVCYVENCSVNTTFNGTHRIDFGG